ncbi:MAG: SGNH/GDSL hydrolase family protein [Candidatus Sericytochromatia bacterium]
MDVKTGPVAAQPAWQRFLNRALSPQQTLPAVPAQPVAAAQPQTDSYRAETAQPPTRQTPAPVALVDDTAPTPPITVGTRVLILGDSQTVGPYGKSIDELARATGATVSTHASWGASPAWFVNGNETYKYWSRNAEGQEATQMHAKTPVLTDLLASHRPDVVVVTLGGNLIAGNASQADVTRQVSEIGNAVSASGARLVWVGPPKYDPKTRSPEVVEQLYQKLGNIVPEFGTLVDSRPHVEAYAGTDGLHYSGPEGERIAGEWAAGVFETIQQVSARPAPSP